MNDVVSLESKFLLTFGAWHKGNLPCMKPFNVYDQGQVTFKPFCWNTDKVGGSSKEVGHQRFCHSHYKCFLCLPAPMVFNIMGFVVAIAISEVITLLTVIMVDSLMLGFNMGLQIFPKLE